MSGRVVLPTPDGPAYECGSLGMFEFPVSLQATVKKFRVFLLLVLVAILMCGTYGVVHDQITYTVSHEYYTRFKFVQFRLSDSSLPDRLKAVIVGFLASWWMGIPIGLFVGLVGFIHRGPDRMWAVTLRSFLVVVSVTLAFGLVGLAYGFWDTRVIDLEDYSRWRIPPNLVNLRSFLRVGYMHNASYLGGVIAIPCAWLYHLVAKRKSRI